MSCNDELLTGPQAGLPTLAEAKVLQQSVLRGEQPFVLLLEPARSDQRLLACRADRMCGVARNHLDVRHVIQFQQPTNFQESPVNDQARSSTFEFGNDTCVDRTAEEVRCECGHHVHDIETRALRIILRHVRQPSIVQRLETP